MALRIPLFLSNRTAQKWLASYRLACGGLRQGSRARESSAGVLNVVRNFTSIVSNEPELHHKRSHAFDESSVIEGVEPIYENVNSGYNLFHSKDPFYFHYGDESIPEMSLAYETWGTLNEDRSNAILIFTGLSASSHAKSHEQNSTLGWWEDFIGPKCALDSSKFFIICCNVLGGCYGTTGPSSIDPRTNEHYGSSFPIVSVIDFVHSQFLLLDSLGINKVHGTVGASLGGMSSLVAAALYPDRVERVVSISSCAQSHPTSIALRYVQRRILMSDPHWNEGFYYNGTFPKMGMKNARELATISYRSGPEWQERFGRKMNVGVDPHMPSFGPQFAIETYLDYQGDSFCLKYDPNSLLYISKAMDLFDMGEGCSSLEEGVARVKCPVLVIGVQSDILFPITQQRDLQKLLVESGNTAVTYYELPSIYGHDTFLLDVNAVGSAIKGHLETDHKPSNNLAMKKLQKNKGKH